MGRQVNIAALVPVGYKNAITRENLCIKARMPDREVRRLIEMSDVLIINLGTGYFIPAEDEIQLVRQYRRREISRIKGNDRKIQKIDGWLYKKPKETNSCAQQISLSDLMEM